MSEWNIPNKMCKDYRPIGLNKDCTEIIFCCWHKDNWLAPCVEKECPVKKEMKE